MKRSNLLEMLRFDFDLSHAFQHVADAIEGFMAKDAEPQPDQTSPRYTCEQMQSMLRHLAHALHFRNVRRVRGVLACSAFGAGGNFAVYRIFVHA